MAERETSLSNRDWPIGMKSDGTIEVLTIEEGRALAARLKAELADAGDEDLSDLDDAVEAFEPAEEGSKKKTDAADEPSMEKEAAGYVDAWAETWTNCSRCTMFRAPDRCSLVKGWISPEGHCDHFDRGPPGADAWSESAHPRGQPENAGEFVKSSSARSHSEARAVGPTSRGGSNGAAAALYKKPSRNAAEVTASVPGAVAAIASARERLAKSVPTNSPVAEGGFKRPDGTYTPERAAAHRRIVESIFTPEAVRAATPPAGTKPTLTLLGGRGGAGKSWLTSAEGPVDLKAAVLLDADAVKAKLPGYEGWNACMFHEESSDVLAVADQVATQLGVNVVHDATMKSEAKTAIRVAQYEKAGYDLAGFYMYASPDVAAERALKRFSSGGTFKGRFVPPEVILEKNVDNEKNFDRLTGGMKRWAIYDNDGREPKFVAGSE